MKFIENLNPKNSLQNIDGPLQINPEVFTVFKNAPLDMLPDFEGPEGRNLKGGRGKDHPRYGRFIYSLAKVYQPEFIVEVGSYAGGTAVGWANALKEQGKGKLIH